MKCYVKLFLTIVCVGYAKLIEATTMEVTASFSPSLSNPANSSFINTTPQGGYCATWPSYCVGGQVSLDTGLILVPNNSTISIDDSDPKDHIYFKFPPEKTINVRNVISGAEHSLKFKFNAISARMWRLPDPGGSWNGGNFSYPIGGCSRGGPAVASTDWYAFTWLILNPLNPAACYKTRANSAGDADISATVIDDISVGYILETPSALDMEGGIYTGSITYSVGKDKEIDFGNKWDPSSPTLTVNFTLTVNHELLLNPKAGSGNVTLQACSYGNVCNQGKGDENWERWMVNRITPELTGKSEFTLSSSGTFSVYIQCQYDLGDVCGLKSDNTTQLIPIHTLITLPDNIVNSSGIGVKNYPVKVGKNSDTMIYHTNSFGVNKAGHLYFYVKQPDVDTMLTTRPDTYRGDVTVMFDANVFTR